MKDYQRTLFPYAYNILGSTEDAKDAVQDVVTNYLSKNKANIENEKGYLIKSVINQAINLKNKRSKTITYSVWLPEPIATSTTQTDIDSKDILPYSVLSLLEKLSPKERATFVLKEAFDYSHQEIATFLETSIENSRKLLSRAKAKIKVPVKGSELEKNSTHEFLIKYITSIQKGDVTALQKIVAEDIRLAADGGSSIRVVRELTSGSKPVIRLMLYVFEAFLNNLSFEIGRVNHQPAIFYFKKSQLYNCQVFDIKENTINNIYSIVDPDKLKNLSKALMYSKK